MPPAPRSPRASALRLLPLVVLLAIAGLLVWLRSAPVRNGSAAGSGGRAAPFSLSDDEARGGHTLSRHVGLDGSALRARLDREPSLAAASSFRDVLTAERAVVATLEAHRGEVDRWASRSAPARLVLAWRGDGRALGVSLERGAGEPRQVEGARVVLARDRRGWFVLTAYPEEPR